MDESGSEMTGGRNKDHSNLWAFSGFTFVVTLGALAIAIAALIYALRGSNANLHVDFARTTYNITLSGVCNDFPVDMIFSKKGDGEVTIEIPYFICDGTVNGTEEGLYFTLPEGYDADIDFARGSDGTTYPPFYHTYVLFCADTPEISSASNASGSARVGKPKKKSFGATVAQTCATFNDSIAYINDNTVFMGRGAPSDEFIAGTVSYGPWYGFTLKYFSTTEGTTTVSAAPPMQSGSIALATGIAVGLALI